MKLAFTVIELILIIVILGILASVAIPKLTAMRDDAQVTEEAKNLANTITNLAASYTATGTLDTSQLPIDCFSIEEVDGGIEVAAQGGASYCEAAHALAQKNNLLGQHRFKGTSINID